MSAPFDDAKAELLAEFPTPRSVVDALALTCPEAISNSDGSLMTICPFHDDHDPSLSIFVGHHGRVRLYCHGCEASYDVFGAVAHLHGLDPKKQFRRVLAQTAVLVGRKDLARVIFNGRPLPKSMRRHAAATGQATTIAPRGYPEGVGEFLVECCYDSTEHEESVESYLEERGINCEGVDRGQLAFAAKQQVVPPKWAFNKSTFWFQSGHRLITPMYNTRGGLRSVRARSVFGVDENASGKKKPKTLTPLGYQIVDLVFANTPALVMLEDNRGCDLLVVTEGEIDFLSWAVGSCSRPRDFSVIGVGSGSWSDKLAARVPKGADVIIRVDHDAAGDKYAAKIRASLEGKCRLLRTRVSKKDENDKLLAGEIGDDPFVDTEELS